VKWEILRGLSDDQQRAVLAMCSRHKYKKGETLFHEGDPGRSLHLLDKGRVAVRVSTPMGEIATLAVLRAGEVFGEQALIADDELRTASAIALEPVETLALLRRDFEDLRLQHPNVQQVLVEVLAAQVRRLSSGLLEALYLPADKRVLNRLIELCTVYETDPPIPAGTPIVIPLTQDDLASMAGTTRPTTNRVLQEAVNAGFVALGRGHIDVTDRDQLRRKAR
jgi:CRP/FNR family transcriptional regulator, cyclic AMP receptor protein